MDQSFSKEQRLTPPFGRALLSTKPEILEQGKGKRMHPMSCRAAGIRGIVGPLRKLLSGHRSGVLQKGDP